MRRHLHLAHLLALVLATSCETGSGDADGPVRLSWRFADGRGCDLAGVVDVVVHGTESSPSSGVTLRCRDGLMPDRHQDVEVPDRPATIVLDGRSITGALLYRGQSVIDEASPRDQRVTLRFIGGQPP